MFDDADESVGALVSVIFLQSVNAAQRPTRGEPSLVSGQSPTLKIILEKGEMRCQFPLKFPFRSIRSEEVAEPKQKLP